MIGATIMTVLLISLLWGVPMYVADQILAKKNYTNMTGFIIGFLLGWVGVLIALVMPFKPEA